MPVSAPRGSANLSHSDTRKIQGFKSVKITNDASIFKNKIPNTVSKTNATLGLKSGNQNISFKTDVFANKGKSQDTTFIRKVHSSQPSSLSSVSNPNNKKLNDCVLQRSNIKPISSKPFHQNPSNECREGVLVSKKALRGKINKSPLSCVDSKGKENKAVHKLSQGLCDLKLKDCECKETGFSSRQDLKSSRKNQHGYEPKAAFAFKNTEKSAKPKFFLNITCKFKGSRKSSSCNPQRNSEKINRCISVPKTSSRDGVSSSREDFSSSREDFSSSRHEDFSSRPGDSSSRDGVCSSKEDFSSSRPGVSSPKYPNLDPQSYLLFRLLLDTAERQRSVTTSHNIAEHHLPNLHQELSCLPTYDMAAATNK